jgi:hypothetical protein
MSKLVYPSETNVYQPAKDRPPKRQKFAHPEVFVSQGDTHLAIRTLEAQKTDKHLYYDLEAISSAEKQNYLMIKGDPPSMGTLRPTVKYWAHGRVQRCFRGIADWQRGRRIVLPVSERRILADGFVAR